MSLKLEIKDPTGKAAGSIDLPADIFDVQANVPLIHQVVVAQLAAARAGTHKAKNRGEVSGGGANLLSSHPASEERMRYLEELIQTNGYNRYGYEGVDAYRQVFPR